jgi:protein-L-isoaspartate(D-aspartate) O-methyltransferase
MTDFTTRRRMMVDTQVRPSDVTEFPIIDAMLSIPREHFVPQDRVEAAYISEDIDLGSGRVLLAPRLFAKMLEALDLTRTDLVLDLGCGYGYSAAVIAHMAEAVVAVEEDEALAGEAQTLLSEQHVDNAIPHVGALSEGAAAHGPYDAIIIEGGVEEVPSAVTDQLKDGGRIVAIFMENALGSVKIGTKSGTKVTWRLVFNGTAPVLEGFKKEKTFAL